jgi:hypothetical protein
MAKRLAKQNSTDDRTPAIPLALLTWLEALYPDKMPDPCQPHVSIGYAAGQVSVVRKLRDEYRRQTLTVVRADR